MPSASAKLEKQASLEASEPLKLVLNVVEKKVRNLEKRKGKLDVYKEESAQGKELNDDQKNAVMRYEEVVQSLEVARELQKQFVQITQDAVKSGKKQAKRDQLERQLHELQRVKEILKVQDVLSGMGDEATRADFLSGANGAPVLTEENLTQLDKLYKLITPTHEVDEAGQTYEQQLASASEHLVGILDGRNKEVLGTTYKGLKELIFRIHDCGYFNQVDNHEDEVANGEEEENQCTDDGFVENVEEGVPETLEESEEMEAKQAPEESVPTLLVETFTQPESSMVAQTISPDDNSVFSTFTHNRPYTEVISGSQGSFNFLQESQIDLESPHMDPAVVAACPMVPTSQAYQSGETFTSAYQSQHVGNDQTIVRVVSPTTNVPPTPQAAQYVQQIPAIQPTDFSQIPTQTFTNQNYVTLQTFSTAVYSQVPAQTVPQAAIVNGPPPSLGIIGAEQPSGIPEPKKHYMNVNATAFESVAYKQAPTEEQDPAHKALSSQDGVEASGDRQDDASTFSSQADPEVSADYPRELTSPSTFQSRTGFSASGRGNRGAPRGSRGMTNGYSGRGSRPNAGFSNGRGSSNYQGYRNEGNNFYQNGYQRDNFGGQSNYNGFKQRGASSGTRGGSRPGSSRGSGNGGMSRGNPRGAYVKPTV